MLGIYPRKEHTRGEDGVHQREGGRYIRRGYIQGAGIPEERMGYTKERVGDIYVGDISKERANPRRG